MTNLIIRNVRPTEFGTIGKLMVDVYSGLEGFPSPEEQPKYYDALANIGRFTEQPHTQLIIATNSSSEILGAVLYFSDLNYYGASALKMNYPNSSAFRLLAVSRKARGLGIGKKLIHECINKAKKENHKQLVIHSTESMVTARRIYSKLGFKRFTEIDFIQDGLEVYGFKLNLD